MPAFLGRGRRKRLHADGGLYDEEKQKVAETVIDALDRTRSPGKESQVEVVDVPTLMTRERYVGGPPGPSRHAACHA